MPSIHTLSSKAEMTSSFDFEKAFSEPEIVKMYDSGMSLEEIAEEKGMTYKQVKNRLWHLGCECGDSYPANFKKEFLHEWREVTGVLRFLLKRRAENGTTH